MIRITRPAAALALLALACEQEPQELPFALDSDDPVTQTVDASRETVLSSPAGASLRVPPQALASGTQITMTPQPTANTVGAATGGQIIPGTVFAVTPQGAPLANPAALDLRFPQQSLTPSQEIGLIAVNNTGEKVAYLRTATVDLSSRVVRGEIDQLGTVGAMVATDVVAPQAGALPPATGGTIASATAGALAGAPVTYAASCSVVSGNSCAGAGGVINIRASESILNRYGATRLGLVGSVIEAELTFDPLTNLVTGSISFESAMRMRLGGSVSGTLVYDELVTGPGSTPQPTPYVVQGAEVIIDGQHYPFTVANNTLTLHIPPTEIELENDDGSTTTGTIAASIVLRRQ